MARILYPDDDPKNADWPKRTDDTLEALIKRAQERGDLVRKPKPKAKKR